MSTPFYRRLSRRRKRRPRLPARPELTVEQILAWADEWHGRWEEWPQVLSGRIPGSLGETWRGIDKALRYGFRGLPGGSSISRLLAKHRGVRNPADLPRLSQEQVLKWADAFHRRSGTWPKRTSGPVQDCPGETWSGLSAALDMGVRGLPGGSSLARLLARERGVRNHFDLPDLSEAKILGWAKAHRRRAGCWPKSTDGPIGAAPGETWMAAEMALAKGRRGLPGGSSLAHLLTGKLRVCRPIDPRPLTRQQILGWADAHRRRTGKWPTARAGAIQEADGRTWSVVDDWLRRGRRTLQAGSSLARLLAESRGVPNLQDLPRLTIKQILSWADVHHRRAGRWPTQTAGLIADAPALTWSAVSQALYVGCRGLPGGSSLRRLLAQHRGLRNPRDLPPLTERQVLAWADAHRKRRGAWPAARSGRVEGGPSGETWFTINKALRCGQRGLSRGSSLARLLAAGRGVLRLGR